MRLEHTRFLQKHEKTIFHNDGERFIALGFEYLAVRKDLQGLGIGTVMTGKVIHDFAKIAESCGLSMMIGSAITKEAFEGFYKPMGFQKYGPLGINRPQMFLPAQSAIDIVRETM